MQQNTLHYVLGLDLGIASVGWSVVEIDQENTPLRLIDLGVRTFDRAEVPKTGESLAADRRMARSMRRSIRRRVHRLLRGRRLLKREGVLTLNDFDEEGFIKDLPINVWALRVKALDQVLAPKEWAAVLLHLIKHRGYLSQRKNENAQGDENIEFASQDKELGALLSGVRANHLSLKENKYRTAAELATQKFQQDEGHIRNKQGAYTHTFNRKDLLDEMHLLFEKQRQLGNPHTSQTLEDGFVDLLMTQRPALSGEAILKMLGFCTFEENEYKAPKNSYRAERFVWMTKLNNLRIQDQGTERALSEAERALLMDEPYKKATLKYSQVRRLLGLPDTARFKGLRYGYNKDPETATLVEMKSWHALRKVLEKANLKTEWEKLSQQPDVLDKIGVAFSIYKTDEDISAYLQGELPDPVLQALLAGISFDQFIQISIKALKKILPLMEKGMRYDEACKAVYGDHYGLKKQEDHIFLPPISADEVRNPVVLRTFTQTQKVINALVRRYGSPARVHIETARELGKSFQDRREIEKHQEENKKDRERAVAWYKELHGEDSNPKGIDILKQRLYELQQGKCLYSGDPIDINRLSEVGYLEVDHALPFSRTWDNSFKNKVLVFKKYNQEKGNKTPYEWLGGASDSKAWQEYKARVMTSRFSSSKKQHLLLQKIDEKGFIERNLNDTRYVTRLLKNFIEDNMHLTGSGKRRVFASNGQVTALLRGRWGLSKSREESDRHHALDAIVVACTTPSLLQRITTWAKYKHGDVFTGKRVDPETGEVIELHFPQPWEFFRQEVMIRVFDDHPKETLETRLTARPQALHEWVTPLFVSRMPIDKVTGKGHLETVRSAKRMDTEGISVQKVPLKALKPTDLEHMVNRTREVELYEALKERLALFKGDASKAFAEPFYKKGGTQVKAIKVECIQKSGLRIGPSKLGVVDNASMVRVDVFRKGKKYFVVPIYAWQVAKGILPNKAVIAATPEAEWEEMDETAQFLFSMQSNDLIKVVTKKGEIYGYYSGLDRAAGVINILEHDRDIHKGKEGLYRGIGVKMALSVEKYQVDILGKQIDRIKKEKRLSFN